MARARPSSRTSRSASCWPSSRGTTRFYQVVRVAGPNLVLGNTILLKHAEINPQCALAIEQLFRDAGAPEGVYTNIFLRIADVEQVIADPHVQGVTLTGSERAGSSVGALAGKHLKKSVLELGGSDPFIVLDAERPRRARSRPRPWAGCRTPARPASPPSG